MLIHSKEVLKKLPTPFNLGVTHKKEGKTCHEYPLTYTKDQREEYIRGFEDGRA